jgi:hypothetical protein
MSHTPALEDEEGRFPNADSGSSVVAVVQPAQASVPLEILEISERRRIILPS